MSSQHCNVRLLLNLQCTDLHYDTLGSILDVLSDYRLCSLAVGPGTDANRPSTGEWTVITAGRNGRWGRARSGDEIRRRLPPKHSIFKMPESGYYLTTAPTVFLSTGMRSTVKDLWLVPGAEADGLFAVRDKMECLWYWHNVTNLIISFNNNNNKKRKKYTLTDRHTLQHPALLIWIQNRWWSLCRTL